MMSRLLFVAFAFLSPTPCEAQLTVTYDAQLGNCKFKATLAWENVAFGDFSYATVQYIKGAASAANCGAGKTIGGTISTASGTSTYEKDGMGSSSPCLFEPSTEYTFYVCDGNDQVMFPVAKTTPEFVEGTTTLTSCSFSLEKKHDYASYEDYFVAKLDLAATHNDGSAGAPGLGTTSKIILTSSAVSGTDCDKLELLARDPAWISSEDTSKTNTVASVSTTVNTLSSEGGSLEFNGYYKPEGCLDAWKAANGKKAVMKFTSGYAGTYASTDGSEGDNFGLPDGCDITWIEHTTTTTTMTPRPVQNDVDSAPMTLPLSFSLFALSLHVAFL